MVKDVSISYGNIGEYDVFPRTLPNLFAGEQLSTLGRFRPKGNSIITFTGKQETDTIRLEEKLRFDETLPDHPSVPRMWASMKIDYLLGEIATMGERKELVDNVKSLGKKYCIITPYTSMLVLEPDEGRRTSIMEDKTAPTPAEFTFTAATEAKTGLVVFHFSLPKVNTPRRLVLRIFDARGRLVRTLADEIAFGGNYIVRWDCKSDGGTLLPSGSYIAVLEIGNRRMMAGMRVVR